ncbi:hypothetical protein B4119_2691 [Parageobacillus caldoxylosilyticus]|uniref:Uncharacterized protein n=1 Tax=Saccharococcus caldoxylosilyticus TaxID=81408 RepID=A0A150LBX4_9BACL|nr:hypothetical protein B4119_2691 [Parageobacillus caldoxylosilyticus]
MPATTSKRLITSPIIRSSLSLSFRHILYYVRKAANRTLPLLH